VSADADFEAAVTGVVASAFGFSGQKCSACSRAIVEEPIYDAFVERLREQVAKLKVGDPAENNNIGPVVNEAAMKTILGFAEIGAKEGRLVAGGKAVETPEKGYYVAPTVIVDVAPDARIAQEEIFGPVVSIIPCDDLEDAIEIANGIEYGLSSALYTKDVNKAFSAIRDLYAGITYINAPTIGAEVHLPFGGTKATGNGHREGGIGAIDFYTEWKSVYVDYSDKLQKAQIDRED
jgi:aldehyde dehydrogenase (NAD+)